ncbi:MAG TPA: GNAT family N-acetyltransferase [Candidatus Limnocylindria bacterium]|nr:GNAT family N-acetyltransferase [Candidatus Limnocylindria bacterium]
MNATLPTLRPATADDHDFVRELLFTTSKDYVEQTWGWTDEIQQLVDQDFERWFNPPARGQIVQLGGRDVGYLKVADHEDGVLLDMVLLDPAYQNRGIGTALIAPVIKEAHARGEAVVLQVLKVNPSKRLYERLGFVVTDELPNHYLTRAHPPEGR